MCIMDTCNIRIVFLIWWCCAAELDNTGEILKWLIANVDGDHIEEVTDEMLEKLVSGDHPGIASIFCK